MKGDFPTCALQTAYPLAILLLCMFVSRRSVKAKPRMRVVCGLRAGFGKLLVIVHARVRS